MRADAARARRSRLVGDDIGRVDEFVGADNEGERLFLVVHQRRENELAPRALLGRRHRGRQISAPGHVPTNCARHGPLLYQRRQSGGASAPAWGSTDYAADKHLASAVWRGLQAIVDVA